MTVKNLYKYSGEVLRIIDGDTIVSRVDLGMKVYKEVVIRLAKINSPEITSKDPEIKGKAIAAKDYLTSLLTGKTIYFDSKALDKYDRSIAELFLPGQAASINSIMVEKGYAVEVKY
jgi:endonuclease YncB( thermonuclease family)